MEPDPNGWYIGDYTATPQPEVPSEDDPLGQLFAQIRALADQNKAIQDELLALRQQHQAQTAAQQAPTVQRLQPVPIQKQHLQPHHLIQVLRRQTRYLIPAEIQLLEPTHLLEERVGHLLDVVKGEIEHTKLAEDDEERRRKQRNGTTLKGYQIWTYT